MERLRENISHSLETYLEQKNALQIKNVAQYRRNEVLELQQAMNKAKTPLALLHAVNDSSLRAFEADEKHNKQTVSFFQRNQRFSRYQLLLQDARTLIMSTMSKSQLDVGLSNELVQINQLKNSLGGETNERTVTGFLDSVLNWLRDLTGHYMKAIVKERCEFLSGLLKGHPDAEIKKLNLLEYKFDQNSKQASLRTK